MKNENQAKGLENANTVHKGIKTLDREVRSFLISMSYQYLGFQLPHRSQERLAAEIQEMMKRVGTGWHNYTLVRNNRGPGLLDSILAQSVKN